MYIATLIIIISCSGDKMTSNSQENVEVDKEVEINQRESREEDHTVKPIEVEEDQDENQKPRFSLLLSTLEGLQKIRPFHSNVNPAAKPKKIEAKSANTTTKGQKAKAKKLSSTDQRKLRAINAAVLSKQSPVYNQNSHGQKKRNSNLLMDQNSPGQKNRNSSGEKNESSPEKQIHTTPGQKRESGIYSTIREDPEYSLVQEIDNLDSTTLNKKAPPHPIILVIIFNF